MVLLMEVVSFFLLSNWYQFNNLLINNLLQNQCANLELEQFYHSYMQRLRVSYLSLFIIIQLLVVGVHSIILLSTITVSI